MIKTQFAKACEKMVSEDIRIFPGTNHSVSPGSWSVIKLVASGSGRKDLEQLIGKSYENITRHIKGQRCNPAMENSLFSATNTEIGLTEKSASEPATESKVAVEDKNRLAETLSLTSSALLSFLKDSTVSDREYLRSLLTSDTKQNLRLSVQALMSEQNFKNVTKEGGLK